MNLVLLFEDDFISPGTVRLRGRRFEHVRSVHRVSLGDTLAVGVLNGPIGQGRISRLAVDTIEMDVALQRDPPQPLDIDLILALPRPKVLNRVVAAATSLGIKRLYLINAWRVEKSYWKSPRLSAENLMLQRILGLEQARDTVLPEIELRRLFRPFVEEELPALINARQAIVAHPYATATVSPHGGPVTLAIGPEGGFIEAELESLARVGFESVSFGERILRVETAVAAIIGRLTTNH